MAFHVNYQLSKCCFTQNICFHGDITEIYIGILIGLCLELRDITKWWLILAIGNN